MQVSLVVAMSDNRVIGFENALPWHLPEDLKRFKALTMGHVMIMGRLTYESIGRPLPGRTTIVLTRDKSWVGPEGVHIAHSLPDALAMAGVESERLNTRQIMVVGGAKIYNQFIEQADYLYVTEVHTHIKGDAYFPSIHNEMWTERSRDRFDPKVASAVSYSFVEYEKNAND